jgi:predicted enzyme related to lactoylglutathione lyase
MGYPVVHFEVMGKDAEKTQRFYADMFEWDVDAANPLNYGVVDHEKNEAADGNKGISGGVGGAPEGYNGHLTFYVAVPDVEAALQRAEELGGSRVMGPDEIPGQNGLVIGLFNDPDGHMVGVLNGGG